ncbi:MAG: hypothetical protein ACTSYC_09490 [Promethearchaeota archaeon]
MKLAIIAREINSKPLNKDEIILRIAPSEDTGFLFYERNMMTEEPRIHDIFLNTHLFAF